MTDDLRLPYVTVIIPTYNRAHMIGVTIESFIHQTYPKDKFEILIVDNNSLDDTKQVVETFQKDSPIKISYLVELRQGVHYARNTGAKTAKGEILYFTDDDMIADANLLTEVVKPFMEHPEIGVVTGRVLPEYAVPPPDWIRKLCYNYLLSINDQGEDMIISDSDIGAYSCHQAIPRDVFFKTNGFHPENTQGKWIGDGETGLNQMIKWMGYKFVYNGHSLIRHMIPPYRMTQKYLNGRLANQGNCDSYTYYRLHPYGRKQLVKNIFSHTKKIFQKMKDCSKKKFRSDLGWRMDRAYINYYMNRIKYDFKLIKDDEWRKLVLKNDWLNE